MCFVVVNHLRAHVYVILAKRLLPNYLISTVLETFLILSFRKIYFHFVVVYCEYFNFYIISMDKLSIRIGFRSKILSEQNRELIHARR